MNERIFGILGIMYLCLAVGMFVTIFMGWLPGFRVQTLLILFGIGVVLALVGFAFLGINRMVNNKNAADEEEVSGTEEDTGGVRHAVETGAEVVQEVVENL